MVYVMTIDRIVIAKTVVIEVSFSTDVLALPAELAGGAGVTLEISHTAAVTKYGLTTKKS